MGTPPADKDLAAEATRARPLQHRTNPPASTAQTNIPLQVLPYISSSRRLLIPTMSPTYSTRTHHKRSRRQINTEVQAHLMVKARNSFLEQALLKTTTARRSAWPVQTHLVHHRMDSSIRRRMRHMLNSISRLVNLPIMPTTISTVTTSRHKILRFLEAISTTPNKAPTIHNTHRSPAHRPMNRPRQPTASKA